MDLKELRLEDVDRQAKWLWQVFRRVRSLCRFSWCVLMIVSTRTKRAKSHLIHSNNLYFSCYRKLKDTCSFKVKCHLPLHCHWCMWHFNTLPHHFQACRVCLFVVCNLCNNAISETGQHPVMEWCGIVNSKWSWCNLKVITILGFEENGENRSPPISSVFVMSIFYEIPPPKFYMHFLSPVTFTFLAHCIPPRIGTTLFHFVTNPVLFVRWYVMWSVSVISFLIL